MFSPSRFLMALGVYSAFVLFISLYLPTRNLTLFLVLLFASIAALMYVLFFARGVLADPRHTRLMAEGREATAVVRGIADTGVTLNNNPYVRLTLEVYPPDGPPYQAEVRTLVSRVAIPRPGDQVAVKYDPRDPKSVIVV